jgi:hypothetical protein
MSRWAIAVAIFVLAWAVFRAGEKISASIDFQTTMLTDWTEEDQEEYEAENYR